MSLTILTTERKIRQFLVYDLEWVPGTLQVRMVGLYDGNRYQCYRTVKDFILDNLTSSNRGKWFYAHAGGLADAQFVLHDLLTSLKSHGYRIKAAFSGSAAIIITVSRGKNSWHLVDSYWLLRDKLVRIAKWIGREKGGGGFEDETADPDEEGITEDESQKRALARREWYATTPFENLRAYNERDCVILWEAIHLTQLAILEEGGQLQYTLASTGMGIFRRRFLTRDIDTSDAINDIAREAYTASRVENIQAHIDDGFYYDVNSSFPYAMTYPCPGPYRGLLSRLPSHEYYIARVRVTVPDTYLPPLPYRHGPRIFFPVGTWEGWYNGVDLQLLEKEGGCIEQVKQVYEFEPFTDLRQYAEAFYAKKAAATGDFERAFYKLILNSLYGKFAESPNKQSMLFDPKTIDRDTMSMLMPGVWLKESIVPVPHVHVPISAHITAIGRRTLYEFMSSCEEVHYCDTDGFSTTEILPTDDKALGAIKLEKVIEKEKGGADYYAAKLYKMNGKIFKGKGFSRLNANRFAQILEGEQIDFERMSRLKELYRKGLTHPEEIKATKTMRFRPMNRADFNLKDCSLPKRAQYPDGTSRPWSIGELRGMVPATAGG